MCNVIKYAIKLAFSNDSPQNSGRLFSVWKISDREQIILFDIDIQNKMEIIVLISKYLVNANGGHDDLDRKSVV